MNPSTNPSKNPSYNPTSSSKPSLNPSTTVVPSMSMNPSVSPTYDDPCNIRKYTGQTLIVNVAEKYTINNFGNTGSIFEQIHDNVKYTIGTFSAFEGDYVARYVNGDYCSII